MKSISVVCLFGLYLCAAAAPAGAQGAAGCFRAGWSQGARVLSLRVDGGRVAGTFTVEGGGRGADFEPCGEPGQKSPSAAARGGRRGGDPISTIRRRYAAINRGLAKYRVVRKELSGFSAEGGELVAYFDGPSLLKVAATHHGETGRAYEEFYYWGGKLIFVFRRQDTYDRPLSGKVSKTGVDRFYFNDGRLIRWVDAGARRVAPGGDEYLEAQARYLDNSKLFAEGARSPGTTVEAPEPNP